MGEIVEGAETIDEITATIIRNALGGVCNEMSLTLERSAYSLPINEGRDFSSSIYTAEGDLVAQGDFDLPAHVGTVMRTVPAVIEEISLEDMRPDDVYLMNDPYRGGTHNNDMRMIKPVFIDGTIRAFVANSAHWSDVGGSVAGSLTITAREAYEEGMRIPPIRIVREGSLDEHLVTLLLANMRIPDERLGDLHAQIASVNVGVERVSALVRRHGLETFTEAMAHAIEYSNRLVRSRFAELEDGEYTGSDAVDRDYVTDSEDPVWIRLILRVEGESAVFDFSETAPAAESSINCAFAATLSAVLIAVKAVFPDVPMNSGIMKAVEIFAPEGSVNNAQHPTPVSGLAVTSMECTVEAAVEALSKAARRKALAASSTVLNGNFSGQDPETGKPFVAYIWGHGGLGARSDADGLNVIAFHFASSTKNIPIEIVERHAPMLWEAYCFDQDSGGPGMYRGGLGLKQLVVLPYSEGRLTFIGNRELLPPQGLAGGHPGSKSRMVLDPFRDEQQSVPLCITNLGLHRGQRLAIYSSGGGGYGLPERREPELVLEDVIDGYVTREAARSEYQVMVKDDDESPFGLTLDLEQTETLRDAEETA